MIDLPIYVVDLEGDIFKYYSIEFAENDLEGYDLNRYQGFDANYKKLELYEKDAYHRVGFKAVDDEKIYADELLDFVKVFFSDMLDIEGDLDLKDLLDKIEAEDRAS